MVQQNSTLPAVIVTLADDTRLPLASATGSPLVIYFYPKDDTAGCTREALDFSAAADDFRAFGTRVIGISRDSPASHAKFSAKHDLTVELASDEDGSASEAFGVWGEKALYGRTYMGLERATFLFDRHGRLAQQWRKVRVPGHVDKVLAAVRELR